MVTESIGEPLRTDFAQENHGKSASVSHDRGAESRSDRTCERSFVFVFSARFPDRAGEQC